MSTHPLHRTGPQRPTSSAPGGGARYDSLGSSYGGSRDDHSASGDSYYDGDDDLSSGAREYYERGASELCTTVRSLSASDLGCLSSDFWGLPLSILFFFAFLPRLISCGLSCWKQTRQIYAILHFDIPAFALRAGALAFVGLFITTQHIPPHSTARRRCSRCGWASQRNGGIATS